jgi:hypothetical protein
MGRFSGLVVCPRCDGQRRARVPQVVEPASEAGGSQGWLEVVLPEARRDERPTGGTVEDQRIQVGRAEPLPDQADTGTRNATRTPGLTFPARSIAYRTTV